MAVIKFIPSQKLADVYLDLKARQAALAQEEKALKDALLALGQRVIEGDYGRVTIVEVEGRVTIDRKLLQKFVPEATLAMCEKTGKPSIRFDVHGKVADAAPTAA